MMEKPIVFDELKEKIIEELEKRAPDFTCPACDSNEFNLLAGFFTNPIVDQLGGNSPSSGKSVPTFGLGCIKCGFISHFALGAYGLLPEQSNLKKEEIKKDDGTQK